MRRGGMVRKGTERDERVLFLSLLFLRRGGRAGAYGDYSVFAGARMQTLH